MTHLMETTEVLMLHLPYRKVDVMLPGKEDSNSHGARPVHLIITMQKWIRTSRLSIKNSPLMLHTPTQTATYTLSCGVQRGRGGSRVEGARGAAL